jgi:aspartyl-tRNA(Asn)/glutamyl-tRNA(Gln) amidotransferase subunit A
MKPEDALELSLMELGHALRRRAVTAVKLAEESLGRLGTRGRELNAVAALMETRALEEARRADTELLAGRDRGPLHGIPYGIKDLFCAKGAPTTWGTRIFEGRVLEEDAAVVQRLSAAGAVLVAKLASVQLAGGFGYYYAAASLQGPGKNPWDRERWAGGSSSGSAAATAARLVPFAIGTETWGSILTPAALCGVVGLRPSYGRVSRAGCMALAWSMDKVGPFARSAEDAYLVLKAIEGPDGADSPRLLLGSELPASVHAGRLKVAAFLPSGLAAKNPAIYAAHEAFLQALGEVADVERLVFDLRGPPAHGIPAEAIGTLTIGAEEASAFEALIEEKRLSALASTLGPEQSEVDRSIRAVDYLRAQRLRAKLRDGYREFFSRFDAICTPSLGFNLAPPPLLSENLEQAFAGDDPFGAAGNLLGLPAVALPGPQVKGLPTGMQLLGPVSHESTLVGLAKALQARTSWHLQRPS